MAHHCRGAGLARHVALTGVTAGGAGGGGLHDHAGAIPPASDPVRDPEHDPEQEAVLADTVGSALLIVLDTLSPAERLAFPMHDLFVVPSIKIGAILERSPDAAKQLASRARHKVQGTEPDPDTDPTRQRQIVEAFLAASRRGDFEALVARLDPDVAFFGPTPPPSAWDRPRRSCAAAVASLFSGRALAATCAHRWCRRHAVGGRGRPMAAWDLTIRQEMTVDFDMLAAPDTLDDLDLTTLED